MKHPPETRISVEFAVDARYPVIFSDAVFAPDNPTLRDVLERARTDGTQPLRVRVFLDAGLAAAQPDLPERITAYGERHFPELAVETPALYPGGETIKNDRAHVDRIILDLAERRLCRHSVVVAAGGGAFLDAVGFAAALVHRGIRLVRIPSTTLSQDDSGVGTKNGINAAGQKNLIGTSMPPWAVINDFTLLRTLDRSLTLDGVAEAFKVAIIKDREFFDFLSQNAPELGSPQSDSLRTAVRRSAQLHAEHIMTAGDPFETGTARPLDFGHWAAHRLEALSGYRIRHGQAVAIGIALDSCYAESVGLIPVDERDAILNALRNAGLPTWDELLETRDDTGQLAILSGIEQFREHLGGQLAVTFPCPIGRRIELHEMRDDPVRAAIQYLGDTANRPRQESA